jgi:L-iditol 2-dehydrogenase
MQALVFNVTPARWLTTRLLSSVIGRRACWGAASPLHLRQMERPRLPGESWVLCRTRLGGICGTDLAMIQLRQPPDTMLSAYSSMPMIPGHENVAQVVEAADDAGGAWIGKRVCIEPTLTCATRGIDPACPRCQQGQFGACESFDGRAGRFGVPAGSCIGYNSLTGGSWGEYFVAHISQLIEVPQGLTDRAAILTDPLAVSLHGVLRAPWPVARRICIIGGGILGLGAVAALRAVGFGGQLDLVARHSFQREFARRFGADWMGDERDLRDLSALAQRTAGRVVSPRLGARALAEGYDLVFDCAGGAASLSASLRIARGRGCIVLVGTSGAGRIDPTPIWFRELTILGGSGRQLEECSGRRLHTYHLVHELMLAGKLPGEELLTHTFALADYRRAFDVATDKGRTACIKAAFDFTVA